MAIKPIKVSQVNNYIKRILQIDPILKEVYVVGEISNLKFHSNGHIYFALKDEKSKINCFLPYDLSQTLKFNLEEGIEVLILGYINVYEPSGTYTLNVKNIDIEGKGQLNTAFEELKEKLKFEGLFDEIHKKQIPIFPKKIGIITSETGAAVHDIVNTIQNKNKYVDIVIFPASVQGKNSTYELIEALNKANDKKNKIDVIIIGRGGGAKEDLSAFNEENLARAIFKSEIPIISAVGHEIDFTISDFVADYRAKTPTSAGEIVVPNTYDIKKHIDYIKNGLFYNYKNKINYNKINLQKIKKEYIKEKIEICIKEKNNDIQNKKNKLLNIFTNYIGDKKTFIQQKQIELNALNPEKILDRGYGIIMNENGKLYKNASIVEKNETLSIVMKDGTIKVKVIENIER